MTEDMQVYITGVLYQQDAYPSDPSGVFSYIDEGLRSIPGLEYYELLINRSECRFLNGSTREQLLIFLKDTKYNGNTFLTEEACSTMRNAIILMLESLTDIYYTDVEVRISRFY